MSSRTCTHTNGSKALEKAGKSLGYDVKMEQQGSMGQVNTITDEEAQAADLVIIASDQKITGMERFANQKSYPCRYQYLH